MYICVYSWVTLLDNRYGHNIANQLYFHFKKLDKLKKKKKEVEKREFQTVVFSRSFALEREEKWGSVWKTGGSKVKLGNHSTPYADSNGPGQKGHWWCWRKSEGRTLDWHSWGGKRFKLKKNAEETEAWGGRVNWLRSQGSKGRTQASAMSFKTFPTHSHKCRPRDSRQRDREVKAHWLDRLLCCIK